ncbi:EXS-domain-containing protein [Exidia glandulosa HHB12029]|uniref:EXS-domain-containing protein n=1 Tax=Exidia glandulosa HHB12029 TaxID=1314781 RepID=A0A165C118_EXIGL|nr:EXS-domain-containing protein [Exidia glandulosa HHB12029]
MDIDTRTALVNALVYAPFSTALPLPFRVALLGGLGILAWALNLHLLHLLGIDTAFALDFRIYDKGYHQLAHPSTLYGPVYRVFFAYSAWTFGGWVVFRVACAGDMDSMDSYKIIAVITLAGLLFGLLMPFNAVSLRERRAFCGAVKRCFLSPVSQPVYFCDVVLADVFTSFAKVFGDVWMTVAMFLPSGSLTALPVFEGKWEWAVPFMMSLPYAVRLRQCLVDYLASGRQNTTQLLNAVKYATAFPVIFLSAMQILPLDENGDVPVDGWRQDNNLWRLWLLSVAVNSLYSFWWDVTNDWGLTILTRPGSPVVVLPPTPSPFSHSSSRPVSPFGRMEGARPYGLRTQLLFPDTLMYYLAVALNLVLRFTWSLKLSAHLHSLAELEHGVFIMEALEILRRWVWVFFRVEWEVIKKSNSTHRGGVAGEEIPMRYAPSRSPSRSPDPFSAFSPPPNGNGFGAVH